MDQEKEQVNLSNLCGGAVEEVFQRELAAVLANVAAVAAIAAWLEPKFPEVPVIS